MEEINVFSLTFNDLAIILTCLDMTKKHFNLKEDQKRDICLVFDSLMLQLSNYDGTDLQYIELMKKLFYSEV